jgi:hypothetical protein
MSQIGIDHDLLPSQIYDPAGKGSMLDVHD